MKKKVLMVGAIMLATTSVFGQKVQQAPRFSNEAEKQAWINAHPEEYARISGEKVSAPEFRTQEEKATWLKNQKATTAVPEFKTQEEKDAYFNGKLKESKKQVDFTTEVEKDAWLRANAGVTRVTQDEFNALPADKKAAMLSDKNYVIIK